MELIAGAQNNSVPNHEFQIEGDNLDDEVNSMLSILQQMHHQDLGIQMETYMGFMSRLVAIRVFCLEREGRDRTLKVLRTQKVQPVIELVEFMWKAASRLVEFRRQEVELSK